MLDKEQIENWTKTSVMTPSSKTQSQDRIEEEKPSAKQISDDSRDQHTSDGEQAI